MCGESHGNGHCACVSQPSLVVCRIVERRGEGATDRESDRNVYEESLTSTVIVPLSANQAGTCVKSLFSRSSQVPLAASQNGTCVESLVGLVKVPLVGNQTGSLR